LLLTQNPGHTARKFSLTASPFGSLSAKYRPDVLNNFNIKQPAFIFEININTLIENLSEAKMFVPIPKFPFTDRDITLIVDNPITQAGDIIEKVNLFQEELMEDICVLDVYSGKPIPDGKKSISLRIVYRSFTETLSDQSGQPPSSTTDRPDYEKFDATLPV
jgi:phenylalanyl-tRNA synthetase beta chain